MIWQASRWTVHCLKHRNNLLHCLHTSSLFFGSYSHCQVATAPYGSQAATLDVEGAYRTIPVWPDHKRFLAIHFDEKFFQEHDVPFGLASASGLQGEVADATQDIWQAVEVKAIKWVDDFDLFRFPAISGKYSSEEFPHLRYSYDMNFAKFIIAPLGVPWHRSKGQDFSSKFHFLGFSWDMTRRSVSLSNEKKAKHIYRVQSLLTAEASHKATLKMVQTVSGSLNHISFVYRRGSSRLPGLFSWLSSFSDNYIPRWAPPSVVSDLRWWLDTLLIPHFSRSLAPAPEPIDLGIWVDASTSWGIGILADSGWDAWQLRSGWESPTRHIGWLEALAVEFAISIFASDSTRGANIIIRSDNEGVIGSFNKGRSGNFEMNASVRRSESVLDAFHMHISLIYVSSASNLADPISRSVFPLDPHRLPSHLIPSNDVARFFVDPQ